MKQLTDEEREYILNDLSVTERILKQYKRVERRRFWLRVAIWLFCVCVYAAAIIYCIQYIIDYKG